jgi:hypothetical protein
MEVAIISDWIQISANGVGPKFINLALATAITPLGDGCVVHFSNGQDVEVNQPVEEVLDAVRIRNV